MSSDNPEENNEIELSQDSQPITRLQLSDNENKRENNQIELSQDLQPINRLQLSDNENKRDTLLTQNITEQDTNIPYPRSTKKDVNLQSPIVMEGEPIIKESLNSQENIQTQTQQQNVPRFEDVLSQNQNLSSGEIILKVDKSALSSLCQNLNSNIIVNTVAYKGVLTKLIETENNENKKSQIEENIKSLDEILDNVKNLMNSVQTNLDVTTPIDPSKIEREASKTSSLSEQLINAQVTTILASLATVAILAGGKLHKKKNTKRKRNKGRKDTKKHY